LKVYEIEAATKVALKHSTIEMQVRPGTSTEKREGILHERYGHRLKGFTPQIVRKWAGVLNVDVREFGIKRMKTKWGSCNQKAVRIWLNLELAKKPMSCI
jgi:predicted metal-dependent hydrolase